MSSPLVTGFEAESSDEIAVVKAEFVEIEIDDNELRVLCAACEEVRFEDDKLCI